MLVGNFVVFPRLRTIIINGLEMLQGLIMNSDSVTKVGLNREGRQAE